MKIIFCEDPLDRKQVDSMYQQEATAVRDIGLTDHLINFESLVSGSSGMAVRRVTKTEAVENAIYRGWMLKPGQYEQLYAALLERNVRLVNTPEMYRHCHHLPESYNVITDYTPRSVWLKCDESFTMGAVHNVLTVFGNRPIIIKDYVKSQKHYWNEACYIPRASDQKVVESVVNRFLELQGTDLNVGLVFREFVEFQPLTHHSRSGMPLTEEYRIFVLDGQPVFHTKYWTEGDYTDSIPEIESFSTVMKNVNNRFFTMDIAKRTDSEWMIVELGDAQVAGLPDHVDVAAFYRAVQKQWERDE